jgi:hypothetical protein
MNLHSVLYISHEELPIWVTLNTAVVLWGDGMNTKVEVYYVVHHWASTAKVVKERFEGRKLFNTIDYESDWSFEIENPQVEAG